MKKLFSTEFLNQEKIVPPILNMVQDITALLGINSHKTMRFRLACEEILTQRVRDAYKSGGYLTAELFLSQSRLEFSLKDKGEPYWMGCVNYNPDEIESDLQDIENFLMIHMVDYFGSEKLGHDGQRFYMQIALPAPIQEKPAQPEQPPLDTNFSIREVVADEGDITNAISCIYDEYGYTYPYERLYYPEQFKEQVHTGMFRSFLAENTHKEIAGHYGLAFSDDYPGMPEWSTVVVKHRFRKYGVFTRLLTHGVQTAEEMRARALLVQPTAYHTATQHICAKQGFTPTGFLFAYVTANVQSEYNKNARRLDLAVAVRLFDKEGVHTVYPPQETAQVIESIYQDLGAKYSFKDPEPFDGDCKIRCDINAYARTARIVVMQCGENFKQEITRMTDSCMRNRVEMTELLLSLCDPSCQSGYAVLKEAGYFFTGIVPGGEKGDYLLMQKLQDGAPDLSLTTTKGAYTALLKTLTAFFPAE